MTSSGSPPPPSTTSSLAEIGVIGLEDTFLVTGGEAEALTEVPRDLTVLEP